MPPKTTLSSLSNAAPEAEKFSFAEPATPGEGTAITPKPTSRVARPLAKDTKPIPRSRSKSANKDKASNSLSMFVKRTASVPVVPVEKKGIEKGQARSQSVASGHEGPQDPATVAIPSSVPSSPAKGTDDDKINVDLNQEFVATCSITGKAEDHTEKVTDPLATHEGARPGGSPSKPDTQASVHRSRVPVTSA